jgi:hypothetical protein
MVCMENPALTVGVDMLTLCCRLRPKGILHTKSLYVCLDIRALFCHGMNVRSVPGILSRTRHCVTGGVITKHSLTVFLVCNVRWCDCFLGAVMLLNGIIVPVLG